MSWWLDVVNAHRAHDAGFTGKGVNLGVLDSGLNPDHREFRDRLSGHSLDIGKGGPVTGDAAGLDGHGTGVAAVAVANRDRFGIHGVAYDAVVTPIYDGFNIDLDDALVEAYAYLPGVGVEILNVSSGAGIPVSLLKKKDADFITEDFLAPTQRSVEAGIVTVVSAGNEYHSEPDFVAGLPHFYPELEKGWLAVVASRSDDQLTSYSQGCGRAANWCIAAPGGDPDAPDGFTQEYYVLPSANGGYYFSAGTSFSAPLVAGALGVTREIFPDAPIGDLRKLILITAADLGDPGVDPVFGWGRLDLGNVVDTISPRGRSIFANAAHTRQLAIEQVAKLPFGRLTRSSRMEAVWATGHMVRESHDAGRSGKAISKSRAFAAGLDLVDQQGLTAGMGVALVRGSTEEGLTANTGTTDGLFGFGYVDWNSAGWHAKGTVGGGYLQQKHIRRTIPGLAGTAMATQSPQGRSKTDGAAIFAGLEAGYSVDAGFLDLTLFGRAVAGHQKMGGFQESEPEVLAYTVEAGRMAMAKAGPGLRLSRSDRFGGWTVAPEVEISYARTLGNNAPAVDTSLLARAMEAQTGGLGRDVWGGGASLAFTKPETGFAARVSYSGVLRRNARQSSLQFGLSVPF